MLKRTFLLIDLTHYPSLDIQGFEAYLLIYPLLGKNLTHSSHSTPPTKTDRPVFVEAIGWVRVLLSDGASLTRHPWELQVGSAGWEVVRLETD